MSYREFSQLGLDTTSCDLISAAFFLEARGSASKSEALTLQPQRRRSSGMFSYLIPCSLSRLNPPQPGLDAIDARVATCYIG